MNYSFSTPDNAILIALEGDMLAPHHYEDLLDKIDDYLLEGKNRFVIDLEGLRFMNSSGLAALCMILTKARKNDGEVALCKVPPHLAKLLIATKLAAIFSIFETSEEAVSYVGVELAEVENAESEE